MAVLLISLFLTIDYINPMKIFLHVMGPLVGLTSFHVATVCIFLLLYVFLSEAREILYFSVKVRDHLTEEDRSDRRTAKRRPYTARHYI